MNEQRDEEFKVLADAINNASTNDDILTIMSDISAFYKKWHTDGVIKNNPGRCSFFLYELVRQKLLKDKSHLPIQY